jgi:hypothetical protein
MNLSSIIKEAKIVQSDTFVEAVDLVLGLLRKKHQKKGNFTISEHLVKLEPEGEALVIGDLHGDFYSLLHILKHSKFIQKLVDHSESALIFLGDYGDRGPYSAEVYYMILKLKLSFPDQVVLLRGNHEGPEDLKVYPHDLPKQFQERFKKNWIVAYSKVRELFDYLYNAILLEERYLIVHGGLSPKINSPKDLACAHKTHPKKEFLEDLLWSDPTETVTSFLYSPRGAGKLFGEKVTENVLKKLGVKILIRGHEQCEKGFKLNHNGRVLTLFSRKGPPYFNTYGAYLQLPLSRKFQNAQQLLQWIHLF